MSDKEQAEVQKFKKNNGREKKSEFKRKVFEGAIKELGAFTYQNDRMSAESFNSAKRSIIDYLNVHNANAGYAIEHNEHFKFVVPPSITDQNVKKVAEDQLGKLITNYYMKELPEAYGVVIGQCDPSLRAALEEQDDFKTNIHQTRDLLGLWKLITEKCLNPIRNDITNHINQINREEAARRKFNEFYQYNRETVAEFYRRFDTEVIAAKANGVSFTNESIFVAEVDRALKEAKATALKRFVGTGGNASSQDATDLLAAIKISDAKKNTIYEEVEQKCLAYEFIKK